VPRNKTRYPLVDAGANRMVPELRSCVTSSDDRAIKARNFKHNPAYCRSLTGVTKRADWRASPLPFPLVWMLSSGDATLAAIAIVLATGVL
jgi:hypothetical protein